MTPKIHIVLIVDKSGSMQKLTKDTIGGFNAYLDGLEGTPKVSAMLFDTSFKVLFKEKTPKQATRLDSKNYIAGGNTALYDAVGKTIEELNFPEGDKVLCVITTDGEENSSTEYNAEKIKTVVGEVQEKGWDFMYIGADLNAWKGAGAMGINPNYTFATLKTTGAQERMSWAGTTNASNVYQYASDRGDDNPLIQAAVSYSTATAPITTTNKQKKAWSE